MIRIDDNVPIETDENGCTRLKKSLDNQLRSGKKIKIRAYEWPYENAHDEVINLDGYSILTDYLRSKQK